MSDGNIRHKPTMAQEFRFAGGVAPVAASAGYRPLAYPLISSSSRVAHMQHFTTTLFWHKKVKIALLALATFIAMC
ncbi:MAG TPA: hypothetical protein VK797_07600 [Tepidisphaeraceae bacterium]|nr:hypothetical protein [Tepidisphaeraceae bacterium]